MGMHHENSRDSGGESYMSDPGNYGKQVSAMGGYTDFNNKKRGRDSTRKIKTAHWEFRKGAEAMVGNVLENSPGTVYVVHGCGNTHIHYGDTGICGSLHQFVQRFQLR